MIKHKIQWIFLYDFTFSITRATSLKTNILPLRTNSVPQSVVMRINSYLKMTKEGYKEIFITPKVYNFSFRIPQNKQ